MLNRTLLSKIKDTKKSILLLGPRQTGKSTLMKACNPDLIINLSNEREFSEFARNTNELESRIDFKKHKKIFIDEIQRIPSITNTIQFLIDSNPKLKFYLTGSSARKLKRGQANLLPGRVISHSLFPLTVTELVNSKQTINLKSILEYGLLPGIYLEKNLTAKKDVLDSYASTYLREEIQAEALVKDIMGFTKFLDIAASYSGSFLDLSKLSNQTHIARETCGRFFQILEDTMICSRIYPFTTDDRRKFVQHPKYYFFDTGVLNGLLRNFSASNDRKGLLFETFIFNQIIAQLSYLKSSSKLTTFRTKTGIEVDFILENKHNQFTLIETKAKDDISAHDLKALNQIDIYFSKKKLRKIILYTGKTKKIINGIEILPWLDGLSEML